MAPHIHLHRAGAQGPVIVFLHGWTMAGDIFADAFARLSGRFACLAPDLPAHGRTTGYAPDVVQGAALLHDLLEREDLRDVTLVGWSLGALLGWQYLDRHGSARVARMMSLDMSPRPLPAPGWRFGLNGQTAAAARAKTAWFRTDWPAAAAAIAATMFAGPQGAPGLGVAAARERIAANPAAPMADYWAALVETDLRGAIARLPVPLLALHGGQSRVYPNGTADWLARSAPQGEAQVFAQAGHAPHLECPETFADTLAAFARGG